MKVHKHSVEEFLTKPTFDEDGVQVSAGINKRGQEVTDPVPVAPPVGYQPPPDLMTMIRTMIQSERFRTAVNNMEAETFEEADDFETGEDDYEWFDDETPYEAHFEPPPDRPPGGTPAASEDKKSPEVVEGGEGGSHQKDPPAAPAKSAQSNT